MEESRRRSIYFGLSFGIIIISGIFMGLNIFQIIFQSDVMEEQKQILDENRHWVEKITFWEVTGGLGENIIEGESLYYEALAKFSAALQAQILAIVLIIAFLTIISSLIGGLFLKFS